MCVCACVRACVRACMCVCVCFYLSLFLSLFVLLFRLNSDLIYYQVLFWLWNTVLCTHKNLPTGSPSRGGDVAIGVFDVNPPSLPTPFYSVLVSVSVFMALSTVFHSINSPDWSAFSLCSSGVISALLVLFTIFFFMNVSLSPDITLCGWLGLKHQLN